MSKVEVKLNYAGFDELRRSDAIKAECAAVALRVLENAGDGYKLETRSYPDRAGYVVMTDGAKGYQDNLKNNTLLKALHM